MSKQIKTSIIPVETKASSTKVQLSKQVVSDIAGLVCMKRNTNFYVNLPCTWYVAVKTDVRDVGNVGVRAQNLGVFRYAPRRPLLRGMVVLATILA